MKILRLYMPYILGIVTGLALAFAAHLYTQKPLVIREVEAPIYIKEGQEIDAASIYKKAAPAVVTLRVVGSTNSLSQGSGFIVDNQGHILTNLHVLSPEDDQDWDPSRTSVFIDYPNGEKSEADIIGYDPSSDLALVKAQEEIPANTQPLKLTDSSKARPGDTVFAIGSPFGQSGSITSGIISATSRNIPSLVGGFTIQDSIQTDAAVNRGNSGGPLLDRAGNVIGINTQIRSESQGNEGVAFAIPSSAVLDLLPKLRKGGKVEYAYIGLTVAEVNEKIAKRFDLTSNHGVLVQEVTLGSPAARAKIKESNKPVMVYGQPLSIGGDIIISVDDKKVDDSNGFVALIEAAEPGQVLILEIISSKGKSREVDVKLDTRFS